MIPQCPCKCYFRTGCLKWLFPIIITAMMPAIFLIVAVGLTFVVQQTPCCKWALCITAHVLYTLIAWCWTKCIFTKPRAIPPQYALKAYNEEEVAIIQATTIPKGSPTVDEVRAACAAKQQLVQMRQLHIHSRYPARFENEKPLEIVPQCFDCAILKPDGTHHCHTCGTCVAGMDHHCPFINNCVHSGNRKAFFLLNAYLAVACLFTMSMVAPYNYYIVCEVVDHASGKVPLSNGRALVVAMFFSSELFVSAYVIVASLGNLVHQIRLLALNMGTLDNMNMATVHCRLPRDTVLSRDTGSIWGNLEAALGTGAFVSPMWYLPLDEHDKADNGKQQILHVFNT